jgi:hypothetical protein
MKFSRLFGSLLFVLATPLVLLADGIKSDHSEDGTLDRLEHRGFSADLDEHLLTTNHGAFFLDSICATVDNDVRRVSEGRKADRIKIKKNGLRDGDDCGAAQTFLERVPLTPRIDWDDDFDGTSDPTSKTVPEPASVVLLGAGIFTLAISRRRLLRR